MIELGSQPPDLGLVFCGGSGIFLFSYWFEVWIGFRRGLKVAG
jgi:hypothetical protein